MLLLAAIGWNAEAKGASVCCDHQGNRSVVDRNIESLVQESELVVRQTDAALEERSRLVSFTTLYVHD